MQPDPFGWLKLGPKWAYRLREAITEANEEDWEVLLGVLQREYRTT